VELDLFWQQAILPALHSLLLSAAQLLDRTGYPQRASLIELYLSGEMSAFFERAAEHGFADTLSRMSLTAQYGILSRTERFQESKQMHQLDAILSSIRDGQFAREWSGEYSDGYPRLKLLRDKFANTTLWQSEQAVLEATSEEDDA
jgi:ketol-acid reductoisomerase